MGDVRARESERVDAFETLLEMGLDGRDFPGLRQDRQKLVRRQEVEPREGLPFLLQVVAQTLLHRVQGLSRLFEVLLQLVLLTCLQNRRVALGDAHDVPEQFVHLRVLVALDRHLSHNVLRKEYRLQILPLLLDCEPELDNLLGLLELELPLIDLVFLVLDIGGLDDAHDFGDVFVELFEDQIQVRENGTLSVSIEKEGELHGLPLRLHLLDYLLERGLLTGDLADLADRVSHLHHSRLYQLIETHIQFPVDLHLHSLTYLLPQPLSILQVRVQQVVYQSQIRPILIVHLLRLYHYLEHVVHILEYPLLQLN